MKELTLKGRKALDDARNNTATIVPIEGTKRSVKIRVLKRYTIERMSELWLEHDMKVADNANDAMKQFVSDPYFTIKCAVLIALNSWWKIILFYYPMVFLWSKIYEYTEEQVADIIVESKKKLTEELTSFWTNMVLLTDMRDDMMKMTAKEAGQYQADALLAVKQSS